MIRFSLKYLIFPLCIVAHDVTAVVHQDTSSNTATTHQLPKRINEDSLNIAFLSYLVGEQEYSTALEANKSISISDSAYQDRLNYLVGICHYYNKDLAASNDYLGKVEGQSDYYLASSFFQVFNNAYLGRYSAAEEMLRTLLRGGKLDSNMSELAKLELAGVYLLMRDTTSFDSVASGFGHNYFNVHEEQVNIVKYKREIKQFKNRSPFLAGVLSAIVPGLGKFYAGYRGVGFGAFIPNAMLGAVAIEGLIKAGVASAQFIVPAAVFSIFYVGNIWGSVLSVKTKREDFNAQINDDILFDMHIPIRRVFE